MPSRTLTITSCEPIKSGVSAAGRAWTLYAIEAYGEDGRPIGKPLSSFADLPLGSGDFDVQAPADPRHAFTLKPSPSSAVLPPAPRGPVARRGEGETWKDEVERLARRHRARDSRQRQGKPRITDAPGDRAPVPLMLTHTHRQRRSS